MSSTAAILERARLAPVSEEALATAGISQSLIRLSVGLEGGDDLVADILAALEAASRIASDCLPYPSTRLNGCGARRESRYPV